MIAVVRSLLGHVIDQHHRFLQAPHDLPKHFASRLHHTFEKRAVTVRMAGMAPVARDASFFQLDQRSMTLGAK